MLPRIVFAVVFLAGFSSGADPPVANTTLGRVSGKWMTSRNGKTFAAFETIPYAKPPVGELRFKAPVALDKTWNGTYDATRPMPTCPQNTFRRRTTVRITGVEDCLYLSVYTPSVDGKRPVLFYIHGGGFGGGSATAGPRFLMDEEIVIVEVSYRVGVLGFLSFEDDLVPGNQGMKDQVLALKWVQKNIAYFGGDPDKVTINGESAGGACTFHHLISPLSKGLYHQAISESGTSYGVWAVAVPGFPKSRAKLVLEALKCPTDLGKESLQCAQNKTAYDIVESTYDDEPTFIGPVLEKEGPNSFLHGPVSKWQHNPVPLIMGVTSGEGLLKTSLLYDNQTAFNYLADNFDQEAGMLIGYGPTSSNQTEVTRQIKNYYLPNTTKITMNDWVNLTQIYTDALFVVPGLDGANNHTGDVYFYYFDYKLPGLTPDLDSKLIIGAAHAAECFFIWEMGSLMGNEADMNMSRKLDNIVANFVKFGTPYLNGSKWKWEKWTKEDKNYIYINETDFYEMKGGIAEDRYKFWKSLKYRDLYDVNSGEKSFVNRISIFISAVTSLLAFRFVYLPM